MSSRYKSSAWDGVLAASAICREQKAEKITVNHRICVWKLFTEVRLEVRKITGQLLIYTTYKYYDSHEITTTENVRSKVSTEVRHVRSFFFWKLSFKNIQVQTPSLQVWSAPVLILIRRPLGVESEAIRSNKGRSNSHCYYQTKSVHRLVNHPEPITSKPSIRVANHTHPCFTIKKGPPSNQNTASLPLHCCRDYWSNWWECLCSSLMERTAERIWVCLCEKKKKKKKNFSKCAILLNDNNTGK